MRKDLLLDSALAFAARIVRLQGVLAHERKETTISRQILRSGTSIGANISEANYGQSPADVLAKMHIALKETAETEYWLRLLDMTGYLQTPQEKALLADCLAIKEGLLDVIGRMRRKEREQRAT